MHMDAIRGAIKSQAFLSSHVGIGSREHFLDGDFLIIAATSSAVTSLKVSSGTSTFLLKTDG